MLNCLFFRIFSSVRMKWVWASARYLAFGRTPGYRRLAKCDAGSSRGRISRCGGASLRWTAVLHLRFLRCPHGGATLAFPVVPHTHTRCRGRKPHTAATRASRRGAGARRTRRVDRADCFHGQKIGTFGTLEGNPPFAVATVGICQNPVFP